MKKILKKEPRRLTNVSKLKQFYIPLKESYVVSKPDLKSLVVTIKNFSYRLYSPFCTFNVENSNIVIRTTKKWEKKIYAGIKTWTNRLEKLEAPVSYHYKVTFLYNKFPVSLAWSEKDNTLLIKNFFGYKTQFKVFLDTNFIKFLKIKDNIIEFEAEDDERSGSEIAVLKTIGRFINKKLSKKVFQDRVEITKSLIKKN